MDNAWVRWVLVLCIYLFTGAAVYVIERRLKSPFTWYPSTAAVCLIAAVALVRLVRYDRFVMANIGWQLVIVMAGRRGKWKNAKQ